MYKMSVKILPRDEVLDSQGRAVEMTLKSKDFPVSACRVGRYVTFELNAANESAAQELAVKITESVLCNELIESYQIEPLTSGAN